MLSGDQFNFPSGYAVQQQQMMDGFITIDLKNGGMGRNDVFEDITDGDPAKAAEQIEEWKKEGIEYVESTNLAEKYKLRLPVHNMNDILFAHLLRVSNFGNSKMSLDSEFCTTLIYAGHMNHWETYTLEIQVDRSNFLAVIEESKRRARAQQQLGYRYMRMFTVESKTVESNNDAHIENLDIDALLDLNPDTMETNRAYPIGDRNWAAQSMLQDIPRLAVRKVDGTPPAYEFGTLRGSTFDKTNISKILFFNTKIERFDSRGFLSLFWGILCRLYWDFRCRFFP